MIGQELLAAGNYESSLLMLESALHIGTCSLKLKGSVFSALSSAYWAMNNMDKAIYHMQQDLAVSKSLGRIYCFYLALKSNVLAISLLLSFSNICNI